MRHCYRFGVALPLFASLMMGCSGSMEDAKVTGTPPPPPGMDVMQQKAASGQIKQVKGGGGAAPAGMPGMGMPGGMAPPGGRR